ncbi:helix-turn-helix domain-containing protein [Plantactinospora sp. ZYX-F-223]|uniref:PucR family transcriptional regulator n=1 Tax=Plantactinospora sp. ZYX-F-223 TaxID=3144103 RepID=UPI0031FD84DC
MEPTVSDEPSSPLADTTSNVPADLLHGYLDAIAAAAATGRRPQRADLDACRRQGERAADLNITLRALTAAYLHATEAILPTLPGLADAPTPSAARAAAVTVWSAARRLLDAAAEGHERSQLHAARRDHTARRELIDDLLYGHGHPGRLAERAHRFGVQLAGRHQVTVTRADTPFTDPVVEHVEAGLAARFGSRNILTTTHDGLLICITPGALRGTTGEVAHHLLTALGTDNRWQIGVGRPHPGPGGVQQSYEEARDTLQLADRLSLTAPVLRAADLLVFPVLLRDRAAITDLVHTVLAPLTEARGGATPILDTLTTFFACHGNTTATARQLHISARTVAYRLDRVRHLTGYDPDDPTQRFTLQAAVLGARLLNWPTEP